MLQNFKGRVRCLVLLMMISNAPLFGQQLVYDLTPDWVYFDAGDKGFLPAVMEKGEKTAISFTLPADEFDKFYLRIIVSKPAYLFHDKHLVKKLPQGTTYLQVDSLKKALNLTTPQLTVFSNELASGLSTVIVDSIGDEVNIDSEVINNVDFNNFFILSATLLLLSLVLLRIFYHELNSQYFSLLRIVDIKTMDELIFKVKFFGVPNNYFIVLMGLITAWNMIAFNQIHPAVLNPELFDAAATSFSSYLLSWLYLSMGAFIIVFLKYLLIYTISFLFEFKTAGIHFASHLRIVFLSLLILSALTLVDHFFVSLNLVHVIFWGALLLTLIRIILLYLRLLRLTNHTVLHLLLYLCATEIIPFVFIYKLVIG